MHQRPKRWKKKPKVDPTNPNLGHWIAGTFWYNQPWMFSTLNRDRPSGHTRHTHRNGYEVITKKRKFFSRLNHRFFIDEGIMEHDDATSDGY